VLVQVQAVGKQIGARWLFEDASFSVEMGDRIGLVGPNGAGKSTLLRVIAGDETLDQGQINQSRTTRLGMLRQEIDPGLEHSVEQEAGRALEQLDELEREMRELEHSMSEHGERGEHIPNALAERYDHISTQFHHGGGFEREAQVARVLAGLGFDEAARTRPLRSFSGGWLMRVELAKLFLAEPDVLLLDEPTNHLDLPAIQWFEETIASFPGALIVVSHDRTFLRRHVNRVVDLDGHGRCTVFETGYDRYLVERDERRTHLLAFRAKSTKAKQAQSRVKALGRIDRIEIEPDDKRRMRMKIPPPPRSGQQVVAIKDLCKSYGEIRVYDGIDFSLRRGERVALAGPNGAGKSTLLRIVAGALDFDSGERVLGHNVQVAFFAQHQLEALDGRLSVLEELERDAHTDDIPRLRGHLGAFLFSGDDVKKKVSVLSGGEKSRVALAKMLLRPANLLVLDEPTNHLDIQSREVLEAALQTFTGTLVFVSHDRTFINALASRVVDVKYGVLTDYIGNYDDYLYRAGQEARTAGKDAVAEAEAEATAASPEAATKTKSETRAESDTTKGDAAPPPPAKSEPKATAPKLSKAERQQQRERRRARDKTSRRISKLEETIAAAEQKAESLGWQQGDPAVYSDAGRLQALQSEQAEVRTEIDAHYAEWERLSDELAALSDAD